MEGDKESYSNAVKGDAKPFQLVIAGGGPAGLLLAHYILDRGGGRFRVRICDRDKDPRITVNLPLTMTRYSIFLTVRGLLSIKGAKGLLPSVLAAGDICHNTYIYNSKGKVLLNLSKDKIPKSILQRGEDYGENLLIDRMELCSTLLDSLMDKHGASGLLDVVFEAPCASVDLRAQTVNVAPCDGTGKGPAKEEAWSYDLLVGADGVNSVVRNALSRGSFGFDSSITTVFGSARWVRVPTPQNWEVGSLHAYPYLPGQRDMNCFLIADNQKKHHTVMAGLVWRTHKPPTDFLSIKDGAGMKAFLKKHLPVLAEVSEECAAQLLEPSFLIPRAVKCSRYHDANSNVALVGDAAHATYPNIGQGCNSALSDVTVLARLLLGETVTNENKVVDYAVTPGPCTTLSTTDLKTRLPFLLARYSALQVRDGHALVDLSYSLDCLDKGLRERTDIGSAIRDVLATIFPWISHSPNLLSGFTTMPYADIWESSKSTLVRCVRANDAIIEDWRKAEDQRILKEV